MIIRLSIDIDTNKIGFDSINALTRILVNKIKKSGYGIRSAVHEDVTNQYEEAKK